MLLDFVLGQGHEQTIAQFDVSLDYELQRFEFLTGPLRHPENIKQVLNQYAAIDASRRVDLIGRTPVIARRIPIRLEATIYLYSASSDTISWSLAAPVRSPFFKTMMMRRVQPFVEPANAGVVATVRSVLPALKEERRQEVREKAAIYAQIMRDNANTVLTFLNVPH